ncbi:uncharacterized protein PFL1_06178 [Pseudozyma flocculosa PF-1]|uniref:BZIP domain-containing protein n=2 Tax=Pseudozyma flocculosa TaxID=84751 RepID=A0A5C3F747_9BASI|nr:uncharacterized protein PFL1_06178 [Pseudozyma flocculosa PF-1]EPQ26243.1 hypothetical protein PFL1_06178 [Pseudozyma flocculosa PF-1]SPO40202.1 uncharacterized protein PSFLO_05684 [Pseudozyma flocculosa]
MGRGRRPNLALEPTRSLQTQRAFRQRKAEHLANLEASVKRLTEENGQLRSLLNLDPSQPAPQPSIDDKPGLAANTPPTNLNPCQDQPKGSGAHRHAAHGPAQQQCHDCARLQETKEHLALAASHVEVQISALNEAMLALRSVLATDGVTSKRSLPSASSLAVSLNPDSSSSSTGHSGFSAHHDDSTPLHKRPRLADHEHRLPSPSYPAPPDYAAVSGVAMTAPFYSRAQGGHQGQGQSPEAGSVSRHLPSPFRPAQSLRAGQLWHSASPISSATATAMAPSPPSGQSPSSGYHHSVAYYRQQPQQPRSAWSSSSAPPTHQPNTGASQHASQPRMHEHDAYGARLALGSILAPGTNGAGAGAQALSPFASCVAPQGGSSPTNDGLDRAGKATSCGPVFSQPYAGVASPSAASPTNGQPASRAQVVGMHSPRFDAQRLDERGHNTYKQAVGMASHSTSRNLCGLSDAAHELDPSLRREASLARPRNGCGDRGFNPSSATSPASTSSTGGCGVRSSSCRPSSTTRQSERYSTSATTPAAADDPAMEPPGCKAAEGLDGRAKAASCCKPRAAAGASAHESVAERVSDAGRSATPIMKSEGGLHDDGEGPRRFSPPPTLGVMMDMRGRGDSNEPCCFGLVECDAEGRILL